MTHNTGKKRDLDHLSCSEQVEKPRIFTQSIFTFFRDNDVVNDPAVKQVVVEQTKQWSEMMERHRKENWELMRDHLKAQEDVLKKAMQAQQQMQIKELENFFEKYITLLFYFKKFYLLHSFYS